MADLATVKQAYLDNASYAEENSVAKARAFETACRQLLLLLPQSATQMGAGTVQFSVASIQAELDHVRQWRQTNDDAPGPNPSRGVKFVSFEGFR